MATKDHGMVVGLRLEQSRLKRADQLIPKIQKTEMATAVGKVSRNLVLRLALLRGLAALSKKWPLERGRTRASP